MSANETRREDGGLETQVGAGSTTNSTAARDSAVFFRDSYAVLVRGKAVRRHLYFSLPAATRTVQRARARGDHAEIVLVKLVPVDARHLDESEASR